jgi:DNA-binding CsgD family transcriptional regulator
MGKAIYIIGDMRLQNSVMAVYLEQATGIKCIAVEDASHILDNKENGTGGGKRLILGDCCGKDLETCLQALLTKKGSRNPGRDLLGVFNLQRGSGVEEKSLIHGVRGFFYQGDSINQIIKGIQAIFEGELWLSRKIMTHYILNNNRQSLPPNEQESRLLSRREEEILSMVAEGAKNEDIADKLCISSHTVKTHLYHIFKKINVISRFQAALWAVKNLMLILLICINTIALHLTSMSS